MSERMRTVRLLGVAIIALFVGIAIGYFIPRPAPVKPTITLSAASVTKGTEYTVTLSGFPANTDIYGWVVNENPPRTFKAGTTDDQGKLQLTGYALQTPETWILCASDQSNQYWASAALTVT